MQIEVFTWKVGSGNESLSWQNNGLTGDIDHLDIMKLKSVEQREVEVHW